MDKVALSLITLAVLMGLFMLRYVFKRIHIPKGLAIGHGFLAIIGVAVLITYNLTTTHHHKHWQSVSIFVFAAMLGLYAMFRDITHKTKNMRVILAHGFVGLAGLIVLCLHVFGII